MKYNPFRVPSAAELATKQYEEAQRQLLAAEGTLEAATANRDMLKQRVDRLANVAERGRQN